MALQPSVDKEVNTLMDTYLKNPQGLEQQVRLDPSLVKGIALERVKELLKAEQNTINAQMQTPPSTVIDQEAQELTGIASGGLNEAVAKTGGAAQAKGIASAMPQRNQNMPKMASGGKVQKFFGGGPAAAKAFHDRRVGIKQDQVRNQDDIIAKIKADRVALIESIRNEDIGLGEGRRKLAELNERLQKIDAAVADQGANVAAIDKKAEDDKRDLLEQLGVYGNAEVQPAPVVQPAPEPEPEPEVKTDPKAEARAAQANLAKVQPTTPKKGLGSIYGDDLAGMQGAAIGNLKDAMTKDPVKAGDDAFKKYRERTNYSGVVAEHDRMRAEQDAVNKRYARSPKQEARDRAMNFFANVASENRGVRGLAKATKDDLDMQQRQQDRTQGMLDKSLEMDKTYLADTMGLNKEAAEKASSAQNTVDTLRITSSQTWAKMQEAERVSANAALDREFQREDSAMKRAHDRVMLILGSEEKMKQLSIAQRAELQQLVTDSILDADQNDMQLMQMRSALNAEKDPEKKAQMKKAIAALSEQKVQAGLAMYQKLVEAGFDNIGIQSP